MELLPARGTIYDRNMNPLATSMNVYSVYAVSRQIQNKYDVAEELKSVLGIDKDFLVRRLFRDKSFVWIARKISDDMADRVKRLEMRGIGLILEPKRFYPGNHLASHIIGYVGMDNDGLEGIELLYDRYLSGKIGMRIAQIDGKQRIIREDMVIPPRDGYDLILTIDQTIQHIAETELDEAYRKWKAKAASIIVMDPYSGSILALANRPTFNPNHINNYESASIRNRAICDLYEPGSVFKIVAASGVLEENVAQLMDRFYCENGSFRVSVGHILHDHKPHGWLTFREIIVQSSNIGTAKVASLLDGNRLYEYIKRFGFGETTSVDMPGEIRGIVRAPNRWSKLSPFIIPIGQEIGITSIQLACTMSSIANGGVLYKPMVVQSIKDRDGKLIRVFEPTLKRRVISPATVDILKDILSGVVEEGTGRLAVVTGYRAAGKTGTAQKLEQDGRYSHSRFVATFAGFVPVDNPALCIVVAVDEPRPYYYGGVVAAPIFSRVAAETLKYLGVPKDVELKTAKR